MLKFLDKIKITGGFYEGCKGRVIEECGIELTSGHYYYEVEISKGIYKITGTVKIRENYIKKMKGK